MNYQKLRTRREPIDADRHRTGVQSAGRFSSEQGSITITCEETICAE